MSDFSGQIAAAVADFWRHRDDQARKQSGGGAADRGARSAVTGGRQMNGFEQLLATLLVEQGCPESSICVRQRIELPGWFRAEKKWDLVVVHKKALIAAVEFKSQIGPSFGNNFNNRSEEALGSATDLWAAYREGAFKPSQRPWLGYLMLLEDCKKSRSPVGVCEPHFSVFPEFVNASYAQRYEQLLTKLVRDRLYDCAALLLSSSTTGPEGSYSEPSAELRVEPLIQSLLARVSSAMQS